jgi:hypothetical protein
MYYTEESHFINAIVQQSVNKYITVVALYDNHRLANYILHFFLFAIINIKFVLPVHFEL